MSTVAEEDQGQTDDLSVAGGESPDPGSPDPEVPEIPAPTEALAADGATLAAAADAEDLVILRGILVGDPAAGSKLYTSAKFDRWLEIGKGDIVGVAHSDELNAMVRTVWVKSEAMLVEGRRNRGKACQFAEAASDTDLDPTSDAGARFPRY
jgi:hypothetical protein